MQPMITSDMSLTTSLRVLLCHHVMLLRHANATTLYLSQHIMNANGMQSTCSLDMALEQTHGLHHPSSISERMPAGDEHVVGRGVPRVQEGHSSQVGPPGGCCRGGWQHHLSHAWQDHSGMTHHACKHMCTYMSVWTLPPVCTYISVGIYA